MMYNNNRHVHVWGENDKIHFCLTCGYTMEKAKEEKGMLSMGPMCDPMFPDGDIEEDLKERDKGAY